MRPALLLVLALMAATGGCATRQHVPAGNGQAPGSSLSKGTRAQIEIFRGLGGYLPGCAGIQKRLAGRGIASTASISSQADAVSQRIVRRRAAGDDSPIVLMGYAVGGGGVRKVAESLAGEGIAVDAIILIDPSFFEPVPGNVRRCFVVHRPELLQTWNSLMRGNPVKAASSETVVVHVNLGEHEVAEALKGYTHLTITTCAWLQDLLVSEAAEVFGLP